MYFLALTQNSCNPNYCCESWIQHIFHRGCLTENRRVGNVGCPYCRGTLERGLTPEATTEKKEALAAAAREQDQRQAIRNAAGRVRMAFA